jgi:hypothetical protein
MECRLGMCRMRGNYDAYLETVNIIPEAENVLAIWINVFTQRPQNPMVDFLSVRYLLERAGSGPWEIRERLEVARS